MIASKMHPIIGVRILAPLGYPDGPRGYSISLGARIVAAADTMDAMTSARPYRSGEDWATVATELAKERGRQLDPRVLDAALLVIRDGTVLSAAWKEAS